MTFSGISSPIRPDLVCFFFPGGCKISEGFPILCEMIVTQMSNLLHYIFKSHKLFSVADNILSSLNCNQS